MSKSEDAPPTARVQYPPIVFTMAAPNAVVRLGAGFDSIRGGFKGTYFKLQQEWIDDGSGLAANMLNSKLASFPPDQQSAIQQQMATNITQGVAMGAPPASLIAGPAGGDGVYLTTSTTIVKKHSDMLDSLDISGSIAISMAAVGNLNGKASYLKEDVQASTSLYFLIKVSIRKSWLYIRDEELILDHKDLQDVLEQDFVKKHGDCFVNGILTGGDFFALIKSETGTRQNKEHITGELSGKITQGAVSGEAQVNLKKNLDSLANESSLSLSFVTSGGKPSTSPQTVEELYAAATAFIKDCQDHPVPIEISLMPYGMLRSYRPAVFMKQTSRIGAFLIQAKAELLNLLMDRYFICLNVRNIALNLAKDPLLFDNYKIRGLHDAAMDLPSSGEGPDGEPLPSNQDLMVASIKQVLRDVQDEQSRIVRFLVAEDTKNSDGQAKGDLGSDAIVSVTDLWPDAPDTTASAFYAEFMKRLPIRKDQSKDTVYWRNVECNYLVLPPRDADADQVKRIGGVTRPSKGTIGHTYLVNFVTPFTDGTDVRIFLAFSGLSLELKGPDSQDPKLNVTGVEIEALNVNEKGFTLRLGFSELLKEPDRIVVSYLALPDPDPRATLPFRFSTATLTDKNGDPPPKTVPATGEIKPVEAAVPNTPPKKAQDSSLSISQDFPPGMGDPTILLAPTAITDARNGLAFDLSSEKGPAQDSTTFKIKVASPESRLSKMAVNWLALPSTASPAEQSAWRYGTIKVSSLKADVTVTEEGKKVWKEAPIQVSFDNNGGRMGGNTFPSVFLAITGIRLNQKGVHVKVRPDEITYDGFTALVQTWNHPEASGSTAVDELTISYLALADYVR